MKGYRGPNQTRVRAWWEANQNRFQTGVRYLKGSPMTSEQCLEALKNGSQRERRLAAHHICLLSPGIALFNTSAPASRQEARLGEM